MHFTCHFPYEVALYLPQRLLNVCYQILHILYTYREADKVWCHTSLTQLLVSKLSMSPRIIDRDVREVVKQFTFSSNKDKALEILRKAHQLKLSEF